MTYTDFRFKADDGQEIFVSKWSPKEGQAKAIIQISHGMAEHIARYDRFASMLTNAGYIVYGNDHRGHGRTAGVIANVGYFADANGFNLVVNDMLTLTHIAQKEHPDLPVFLFGHSMGSLLSRNYITKHGEGLKGVILSGTMGDPGLLGKIGGFLARRECQKKGKKAQSPFLDKLSFGKFNNAFRPNRTQFDWLSRDNAEVDKYIADPYCGSVFTAGFFLDFLTGMQQTFQAEKAGNIPKQLPVLFMSGDKDPVGNNKKGVEKSHQTYLANGMTNVKLKFYKDGRHEMLNEKNRDEVYQDILYWISSTF